MCGERVSNPLNRAVMLVWWFGGSACDRDIWFLQPLFIFSGESAILKIVLSQKKTQIDKSSPNCDAWGKRLAFKNHGTGTKSVMSKSWLKNHLNAALVTQWRKKLRKLWRSPSWRRTLPAHLRRCFRSQRPTARWTKPPTRSSNPWSRKFLRRKTCFRRKSSKDSETNIFGKTLCFRVFVDNQDRFFHLFPFRHILTKYGKIGNFFKVRISSVLRHLRWII